jgi:hypothetical protein
MLTLDRICFEDLFKFWSRWFFNGIPMFSEFVEHQLQQILSSRTNIVIQCFHVYIHTLLNMYCSDYKYIQTASI